MIEINALLTGLVVAFGVRSSLEVFLNRLNTRNLRRFGNRVPHVFEGLVDEQKLARVNTYTTDSNRIRLIHGLCRQGLTLVVLLSGFLPWLAHKVSLVGVHSLGEGLIFFATLSLAYAVPGVLFDLYSTFVIEERYGFNATTLRIWVLDLVKQTILSVVLGGLILGLLLTLIRVRHDTWWIWAWMIMAAFEATIMWLYPVVIAPWFNRFEPISDRHLEARIRSQLEKAGLRVGGVFQMDAAKRTHHTNAFLTGLGTTKRIVLFDSLLHAHSEEEILAVLCHEVGHWKRAHLIKILVLTAIITLCLLFVTARALDWPLLYRSFGFQEEIPFVGLFLVSVLLSVVGYFFRPVGSSLSRRFETEADDAAVELMGTSTFLVEALRKLSLDNLTNLCPHPLFVWFHYSHPPVVERIGRLDTQQIREVTQ
jgi:STE24 endopeptidase